MEEQRQAVGQVLRDEEEASRPLPPAAAANDVLQDVVKVPLLHGGELMISTTAVQALEILPN